MRIALCLSYLVFFLVSPFSTPAVLAGNETDQIAFWDLSLGSSGAHDDFVAVHTRLTEEAQKGFDSDQVFYWSLKETEAAGRLLGHLILDIQQLEALQLQLQWGARAPYLLGARWTYQQTVDVIARLRQVMTAIAEGNRDLCLALFALGADKRLRDAKDHQARLEQWYQETQAKLHPLSTLWRWLSRKPPIEKPTEAALQAQLLQVVTDEAPIQLPRVDRSIAIPSQFADQLIDAYWRGLSSVVGHLLTTADQNGPRVIELNHFTRRIKIVSNLSQLDGTEVRRSCVSALAAKKRN